MAAIWWPCRTTRSVWKVKLAQQTSDRERAMVGKRCVLCSNIAQRGGSSCRSVEHKHVDIAETARGLSAESAKHCQKRTAQSKKCEIPRELLVQRQRLNLQQRSVKRPQRFVQFARL